MKNGVSTDVPEQDAPERFSIAETLRGKHILISGTTGFLGKVAATLLLDRHPDIEQLYLLIRGSAGRTAEERFWEDVATSPALKPLRDTYTDGFEGFLSDKITVVEGDVTREMLGIPAALRTRLRKNLDVMINSAGLTNFAPSLEQAIAVNCLGPQNCFDFVLSCENAGLVHVSTTYVTGRRDGVVTESEDPYGFYPKSDELHIDFSPERELQDCQDIIAQVKNKGDDQERRALFVRLAREWAVENGRNLEDADIVFERAEKEKENWVNRQLRDIGTSRAAHWGWNNTYTYAKSLGEQFLSKRRDEGKISIVRPAIVESSLRFPFPGWNEGINTCGPLSYLLYKGVRFVPTQPHVQIDVVPVDFVANCMLAAGAASIAGEQEFIYQVGSSERNPVSVARAMELLSLSNRQFYAKRVSEPRWKNLLMSAMENVPVSKDRYERYAAPGIKRLAGGIVGGIKALGKTGVPAVDGALKGVSSTAKGIEKQAGLVATIIDLFMPFIHDSAFVFQADAMKRLEARLPPEEADWGFPIEGLNWRYYWMDVQMPGMHKHVFPEIDKKFETSRKKVYTPNDLLEVFKTAAANHQRRIALQQLTPEGLRRFTYGELQEHAERAARNLVAEGISTGVRIVVSSENRPEWGMAYLGTLTAGAAAVPVDCELPLAAVLNVTRTAGAQAMILSDKVLARLRDEGLDDEQDVPRIWGFEELFAETVGVETTALVPVAKDDVASLIFTSGTTGRPKGVMLAHKNFTSLLTSMNQVFDVSDKDGFLSVLPLHHTFEFTCGFLMPLSKGATITYLDELTGDSLNRAFSETRVTAMIGVPALWQLLHRRIMGEVSSRGPQARTLFDAMLALNRWAQERFRANFGRTLFAPVHKKFGGRIRYLISGGASLPAPIMETFHGLGFELLEGYGLTEASPVLTCGRPSAGVRIGSVGKALPGVEVKIKNPDGAGVGEIIAKGGNVMLGYLDNPDATVAVLDEDGWLSTGDLGRLDKNGYVYISGRAKDVIVAANGENVYPDELEEMFETCEQIEELSVVGLPDGNTGERVAMLVRTQPGDLTQAEAQAEVRKAVELGNVRLQYHQRIKILRFTDEELPRTATRKVKRTAVRDMLMDLEAGKELVSTATENWGDWTWLRESVANLAAVEATQVGRAQNLIEDLGFDSLAFTELAGEIERRTGKSVGSDELIEAASAEAIIALVRETKTAEEATEPGPTDAVGFAHLPASMRPQEARRGRTRPTTSVRDIIEIPEPVRVGLKGALSAGQVTLYRDLFDVKVHGRAHIPFHESGIVCANHCSHLDMGLVKYALRDWAPNLSTLAASDYFFDNRYKRTYFGQLTNLIPVDRSGSLEQSMRVASAAVSAGKPLLLFPEGTRSTTGDVAPFRPGLGFLALHHKVGVLPVYLGGTYRALPKGAAIPKRRHLAVHVGELIPYEYFVEKTKGMSNREAYGEVSRLAREAVVALKAGRRFLDGDDVEEDPSNAMLETLFRGLEERFQRNQVDEKVSYYFSLGPDDAGKWTLVVDPENCLVQRGKPTDGRADCVVKTTPEMFNKMISESYVPTMDEFMSGKIKTNDPNLLMMFQNVFGF
jgi:long-chain acyl-CoA synthetase